MADATDDRDPVEVLAEQFTEEQRHGRNPSIDDYAARYPQHAAAIRDLFPALAVIEGLSPIQVETLGPAWIDTHVDPAPSSHVGDYRILRQIGRGGMGVVYEAVQQSLSRHVALKVLPFHAADDAEMRERFHREAEAAARLDHPHIVPVYEVGEHEGCPYFSMKYVEGTTLAERLSAGPMPARDAARLLLPVARAIAEAHRMGVLHRDLKPANILLDSEQRPLVADFGLAKRFEAGSDISRTNALAGTPSYMAPEQASGRWQEVGVATDVYGLGAVLYHMLTARPPFQAATVVETLKQVTHQDPVSPRQLNAAIDRDLDTICLKCLAKEPRSRYESAAALADDLERYISGRTIVARPVGRIARTLRWCRRNPAPTAALALLAVTCAALVGAYGATSRALADSEQSHLQTRAVVNDFLVRIGEDPRFDRPGMQPLRRDLLTKAREHYERFLARNGEDPALREELADTHHRLGLITEAIDTPQAALAAYAAAEGMQRELVQERPQSTARREALSKTLAAAGRVHFRQHDLAQARADYTESEKVRRQLVAENADNREFARLLANAQMHLGLVDKADGDFDAARRQFDDGERVRRRLLAQDPASFEVRRDLAKGLFNQANLDMKLSEAAVDEQVEDSFLVDAEARLVEATHIFDQLDQEQNSDPEVPGYLALCWRTLAHLKGRHSPEEANHLYARVLPRLEDLTFQNLDVVECQAALGGAYMNQAEWELRQGRALTAIERFHQARRVFEGLVRAPTDDLTYRNDLATTRRAIGELEAAQLRYPIAREHLQAAYDLFDQLAREAPQRADLEAQRLACSRALEAIAKQSGAVDQRPEDD